MQKVHLKRTKRLHNGHLWVFSNELYEGPKGYVPGALVEVCDMNDACIGTGYINPNSLISVRLLAQGKETIDSSFLRSRIQDAIRLRSRYRSGCDAYRLIYSEGDYLPGLIADRYGSCLVLQFTTYGMEVMKEQIIGLLDEMLNPETIIIRNDGKARSLEGLPLYKELVKGRIDTLPMITEDGVRFEIDPYEGQKTGFFLDQRENRITLKTYIRGGRGLDLFSYIGAWTMHLASEGAAITCVDASEKAIAHAVKNAALNEVSDLVDVTVEDVFRFLEKQLGAGENRYDFIVLDPPAFVKSAGRLKEAVKAYREINEMSMRLIRRGGILATSSCSYHMNSGLFRDMLNDSARNAKRSLRLLEFRSQAPDHPVLLAMPETEYLKCAFLVVD